MNRIIISYVAIFIFLYLSYTVGLFLYDNCMVMKREVPQIVDGLVWLLCLAPFSFGYEKYRAPCLLTSIPNILVWLATFYFVIGISKCLKNKFCNRKVEEK